jgi:type II secretory pathway pseudopilin PulG
MLRLAQSNRPGPRVLGGSLRPSGSRAAAGFSLIELLLVVGLILLLTSAFVLNFSSMLRGNQLEEGTTRLETLMRYARAQAAQSGRKVQLVFGPEATNAPAASTGEVRATWERDPLGQPGCFSEMGEGQWHLQELNDLVQVESVKLFDASGADPVANACSDPVDTEDEETGSAFTKSIAPITFYPDGSSDSAEIVVAARSPEEDQRMTVRLVGITGSISHQLLSANLEESEEVPGLLERANVAKRDGSMRNSGSEREANSRLASTRASGNSSRPPSTAPRSPVGETNTVDFGE